MIRYPLAVFGLLFVVLSQLAATGPATAVPQPAEHPSVIAARDCARQIGRIIGDRTETGPDISCDIPVVLTEADLKLIFKDALRAAALSDKWRGYAEKYGPEVAAALTDFRAVQCTVSIRAKRAPIIAALKADQQTLKLGKQPVDCEVTSRKRSLRSLHFVFDPEIDLAAGCVQRFALNMGEIDANCRVCYFDRLYLATTLVAVWANYMAPNITVELNHMLGGACAAH